MNIEIFCRSNEASGLAGRNVSTFKLLSKIGLFVAFAALMTACGGDSGETDPCANKVCEYGVCDSETGECVNASLCGESAQFDDTGTMPAVDAGDAASMGGGGRMPVKQSRCLEGYTCQDGACVAEADCDELNPCARGVCQNGACVDEEPCERRADCRPGKGCSEAGVCENLCDENTCERGVCNPETGGCLNARTCTPDETALEGSNSDDCLAGYKCVDADEDETFRCRTEEAYCSQLACERGVCSFEELRCVDADNCASGDDCVEGNYCDTSINECKNNVCNEQMTDCPRGTCEESTGECVNPDSCSASDQCLPDHLCVEGRCVPSDNACGPNGCPGSQVCEYSAQGLSAECQEAPGGACRNAVDCTGNSVCREGTCQVPSQCQPDQFEPNDTTLVPFLPNASNQTIEANLCGSGDVDRFSFDTQADRGNAVRGTLLVDLVIEPSNIGQGSATIVLTDTSGTILARASTGSNGRAQLRRRLSATDFDTFQIKISGANLNPAGLEYSLFASVTPRSVTRACSDASVIEPNAANPTIGTTQNPTSIDVQTGCTEGEGAAEDIYTFNIAQESYVTVQLNPTATANEPAPDLALALRGSCASVGSERACANLAPAGGEEITGRRLASGTYAVIVEGSSTTDVGRYRLQVTAEPIICSIGQNECTGSDLARVCRDNGTTYNEIPCSNGCNEQLGRCNWSAGENCFEAIDVGESAIGLTPEWSNLSNWFEPNEGCIGGSNNVLGPDIVYEVTVPAGETMEALFEAGDQADGSALYLTQNCEDPAGTCIGASDRSEGEEVIVYKNESGVAETLFLVADTASGTTGTGTVDIRTGIPSCQPGNEQCAGNTRRVCRESGLRFEETLCQFSCENGACQPPSYNSCEAPYDLSGGGSVTHDWADLNADYNPPGACIDGDSSLPGEDAVYSVDLASDEILTLDVTPQASDGDPALYITDSCGSPSDVASSCLTGIDDEFGGDSESLTFTPPGTYSGTKTFYVFVDSDETSGGFSAANGQYTLTANVQTPICNPGERSCVSGDTLEYCASDGLSFVQHTCQSGATCISASGSTPARCSNPTGEVCVEAIGLDKNGSITTSGGTSGDLEIPEGTVGGCNLGDASDGNDQFYRIDLSAGDLLTASLNSTENDAQMYIMGNCISQSSCLRSTTDQAENLTLEYFAEQQETIYLVVDSNFSGEFEGKYTLNLNTSSNLTCQPNATQCDGTGQVQICNETGTGFAQTYACSNGCSDGACNPVSGSAACGTAPDMTPGTVITDVWSNYSNNINLSSSACGIGSTADGSEAVYALDVVPGEIVQAELENLASGDDDPMLYILDQCAQPENNCVVGAGESGSGTASLEYLAVSNTTLYIVADNDDSVDSVDPFRLSVQKKSPTCASPGQTACSADGQDILFCQPNGLQERIECPSSCQNGACQNPTGETCVTARDVGKNETIQASGGARNSLELPDGSSGNCSDVTATDGNDRFYEVDLQAGDYLRAELESDESDAMLYVLENCYGASSCRVATREGANNQQIGYRASSDETIRLAVDSTSANAFDGSYTLDLTTTANTTCEPGARECTASNQVSICDGAGEGYRQQFTCPSGMCSDGECVAQMGSPPPQDTCSSAPDIGVGTVLTDEWEAYSNDIDIASSACNGMSDDADGLDAVYKVTGASQGDIIEASVELLPSSNDDAVIYLLTSCSSPGSNCVVGASEGENTASLRHTVTTQGPLYVAAENLDVTPTSPRFRLSVETLSTNCTGSPSCTANNLGIRYCDSDGVEQAILCDGGCQNGTCNQPSGERCLDPFSLASGESFSGNFSQFDNDIDVGTTYACGTSRAAPEGPDAVFKVTGYSQGETLVANLSRAPDTASMYVLSSCPAVTPDPSDQCEHGVTGERELRYRFSQSGPVYLVVDSTDDEADSDFRLELSTETGNVCQPGGASCTSGGNVEVCNAYGDAVARTFGCATSCDAGGVCAEPSTANDTCSNTLSIGSGTRLIDDYDRFASDIDPGCADNDGGEEAIYSVDVPADNAVEATVKPLGDNSDVSVYITDSCPTSGSSVSCLAGSSQTNFADEFASATTGYHNSSSMTETVYLVVDHDGNPVNEFLLDVEVSPAECNPGSNATSCLGPDTEGTCTSYHLFEASKTCYWGCPSGSSECTAPPNDQCSGAVTIEAGRSYFADIGEYTDDYNHLDRSQGTPNCIKGGFADGATAGPDSIYQVQLNEGDYFNANLLSPGNTVQWVTNDCEMTSQAMADACVAGENSGGGNERVQFTAPADDTYYVITDVNTGTGTDDPDGELELQVDHAGDTLCDPTTRSCKSGSSDVIRYCQKPGMQFSEKTCAGSCQSGACSQKTGDFCEDAVSIQDGSSISYSLANYSSDYDLTSSDCLDGIRAGGSDRVFQFELSPNEQIEVDASSSGNSDVQMYVVEECGSNSRMTDSCRTATNATGPGGSETLTFAPEIARDRTFFLVIDAPAGATNPGTISGSVSITPP